MKRSIAGFGFTLPVGLTASSICCRITRYLLLYRFHPPHMPASITEPCHGWSRMLWKVLFDASHSSTASLSLCQTREEQVNCVLPRNHIQTLYRINVQGQAERRLLLVFEPSIFRYIYLHTYLSCAVLPFSSRVSVRLTSIACLSNFK